MYEYFESFVKLGNIIFALCVGSVVFAVAIAAIPILIATALLTSVSEYAVEKMTKKQVGVGTFTLIAAINTLLVSSSIWYCVYLLGWVISVYDGIALMLYLLLAACASLFVFLVYDMGARVNEDCEFYTVYVLRR